MRVQLLVVEGRQGLVERVAEVDRVVGEAAVGRGVWEACMGSSWEEHAELVAPVVVEAVETVLEEEPQREERWVRIAGRGLGVSWVLK